MSLVPVTRQKAACASPSVLVPYWEGTRAQGTSLSSGGMVTLAILSGLGVPPPHPGGG